MSCEQFRLVEYNEAKGAIDADNLLVRQRSKASLDVTAMQLLPHTLPVIRPSDEARLSQLARTLPGIVSSGLTSA